ncbi:MAG: TIM barrel protein [Treponema sp.]|jgi:deoxyribonuclease-4|nr:TIM barrel protein [Treponema sp.]
MFHIGCHLSAAKGYAAMGTTALRIGADTFQFFTRNPRGGKAKYINPADVAELLALMKEYHFPCILAHVPYTMNLCSADEKTRAFSIQLFKDDLNRMEYTPHQLYNFHPGSHKDRHECIGKGYLGLDALAAVVMHPALAQLPFYLETPNDPEGHSEEIRLLKKYCNQQG